MAKVPVFWQCHLQNSDVVLAAIDEWFTFFNNDKRGVYKSIDGGLTWTRKLEFSATDLVVDPDRSYTPIRGYRAEWREFVRFWAAPIDGYWRNLASDRRSVGRFKQSNWTRNCTVESERALCTC